MSFEDRLRTHRHDARILCKSVQSIVPHRPIESLAVDTDLLRRAREARGVSLADLARATRITPWILQKLDEGKFGEIPAGIYARHYLRAFASAVGLHPDRTLEALEHLLPAADTSIAALSRSACQRRGEPQPDVTPAQAEAVRPSAPETPATAPRMPEPDSEPAEPPPSETSRWRLYGAAVTDVIVLSSLQLAVFGACAWIAGFTVQTLMLHAAWPLGIIGGTVAAIYFGLLGGIAGRTCGAWLLGIRLVPPSTEPLDLRTVLRRSMRCLVREASILVGIVLPDAPGPEPAERRLPQVRPVPAKAHLPQTNELPVSRIVGL
jgi:uncharacterized RDD family membrane protein YckC